MDTLNRERMAHVLTNENARLAPGAGQRKESECNCSAVALWIKGRIMRAALRGFLPVKATHSIVPQLQSWSAR